MAPRNQILTVREQTLLNLGRAVCGWLWEWPDAWVLRVLKVLEERKACSWKEAPRLRDSRVQVVSLFPLGFAWARHSGWFSAVPQSP